MQYARKPNQSSSKIVFSIRVDQAAEPVAPQGAEVGTGGWVGSACWAGAGSASGVAGGCCCDTKSHVVSELVKEARRMSKT